MKKIFVLAIGFISFLGVSINVYAQTETANISVLAEAYFDAYAKRDNWSAFLEFYDEDIYFEDLQFRLVCAGLDTFERFYDWPNPDYKKVDDTKLILKITRLLTNDSVAIASGFFDSFYWQNMLISGPWEFTITLTFNDAGKITKQTDFINYPLYFLCSNQKLDQDAALRMKKRKHLVHQPKE